MKLIALMSAGALAAGTLAAVPAEAQRYGHGYGHGYGRGYGHGYGARGYGYGHRGYGYGHRGYGYGYGYRAHYRGGYYGRPRVVCRLRPGYYGPVRRCFRTY